MPPIPDGCVLLLTGSRHITRPWGCGRLSNLRPALVVHGGAIGAETVAATFFAKSGTPVEISTLMWFEAEAPPAYADNGGTLAHAQVRAQEMEAPLFALALWDLATPETNNMVGRLNRAKIPTTVLRQLAPNIDDWSDDLREELYEVSGRYINDRIKSLSDPVTDDLKQRADLFAEGVIRSEFAWR
jgi:hypothetical protein